MSDLPARKYHQTPQSLPFAAVYMVQEAMGALASPSQCPVESCSAPLYYNFIINTNVINIYMTNIFGLRIVFYKKFRDLQAYTSQ